MTEIKYYLESSKEKLNIHKVLVNNSFFILAKIRVCSPQLTPAPSLSLPGNKVDFLL